MDLVDAAVREAASWQLASELVRRHPGCIRLFRGHPGGGQYDLLWLVQIPEGRGDIRLNRNGTIQVHGRFDDRGAIDWIPTGWDEYLASDPKEARDLSSDKEKLAPVLERMQAARARLKEVEVRPDAP